MSENAKRRALLEKQKNGYDVMSAEELKACHEFNEDYKYFIDAAKTEREAVDYAVEAAKAAGFKPYKRGDKHKHIGRAHRFAAHRPEDVSAV